MRLILQCDVLSLNFSFFQGIVIYDNKFETKENIFLTKDKMEKNLGL